MVLPTLILLPLIGAVAVALVPRNRSELVFPLGLAVSIPPLVAALWVAANFTVGEASFQFVTDHTLSESLGIGWRLGIDGISLWLVVLTALLFPLAMAASTAFPPARMTSTPIIVCNFKRRHAGIFFKST